MSKFLTVLGIFYFSVAVQATPSSEACFNKIAPIKKWESLQKHQAKCMKANSYFNEALALLCSIKGKDFSAEYVKYRLFEVQYLTAQETFKNATRAAIQQEALEDIAMLDRDWVLFGFRDRVDTAFEIMNVTRYNCIK